MSELSERLGLTDDATVAEIDAAYLDIRETATNDEQRRLARYAWKVLRDPYFSETYRHYPTADDLIAAGFFDDNVEPEYQVPLNSTIDLMTTPLHKAYQRLVVGKDTRPPVVLFATGAFSPIHRGHLQMMERARRALEKQGRCVIGGYLSPSHDAYVSLKYDGQAALSAAHRIQLCEVAVEPLPWLMTDSWNARYAQTELLFTDVGERLQSYLRKHLHPETEVFYVFGSDNAAFMRAFVGKGGGVCIVRAGHEHWQEIAADPLLADGSRFVFAENDAEVAAYSSSAVRSGNMDVLPNRVVKLCERWGLRWDEIGEPHPFPASASTDGWYAVRDDLGWAMEQWGGKVDAGQLQEAAKDFRAATVQLLEESFQSVSWPDRPLALDIVLLDHQEQQRYVEGLLEQHKLLSLDISTPGTVKLELSRLFGVADGQVAAHELIGRPWHPPFYEQAQAVPAGSYLLVDDDIATGYTLDTVCRALAEGVEVTGRLSLLAKSQEFVGRDDPYDVIDLRDLLLGGRESGLVVQLPNGLPVRAPYMLPYVNPVSRAKIPPSAAFRFSEELWRLNEEFFTGLPLHVGDLDPLSQSFLTYLGFSSNSAVAEVCRWHRRQLAELPFRSLETKTLSPSTETAKSICAG